MRQTSEQQATRTLVVGLGESGYSVIRHLCALGEVPSAADDRDAPPMAARVREEFPGVEILLGDFSLERFRAFERVVVSPGISVEIDAVRAAREAGVEVLGDIELFARQASAPVIAITGSNGKSTVTRLVGELLDAAGVEARVGGNIGVPALDLLRVDEPAFYVLELSSFQLETTSSLAPACAVVLNLSPDHMDRYPGIAEYGRAKARVYANCRVCVVNRDDPLAAALAPAGRGSILTFGLDEPQGVDDFGVREKSGRAWLARGTEPLLAVDALRLQGSHNIANVLAALALVAGVGIPLDAALTRRAAAFAGLPHRMELVAEQGGVRWINDSKGTNVGAACAAIQGLDAPIVLIAGGQGKAADFAPLAAAARGRVRHAILFGADRRVLAEALCAVAEVTLVDNLERAVELAAALAAPGDAVLLSPACASLDMFRNFEHRGDVFRALVREAASCRP